MPWRFALILCILALAFAMPAQAIDDYASLYREIQAANARGSGTIALSGDITLTGELPAITSNLVIEGNGHSISGDDQFRIFAISGGHVVLRDIRLTRGQAKAGGAIRLLNGADLHIEDAVFSQNRAETGGAISTHGHGNSLTIIDSSFIGNRAEKWAGAIDVIGGAVSITGSSLSDNSTPDYGGAIVLQSGIAHISNSTLHGNRAKRYGGAIQVFGDELTLTHVTMTNNVAADAGGNAINRQDGVVKLRNSIVASRASQDDCAGALQENIGNLSTDGSCGILPIANPLLGQLSGAPAYIPLLDGSPALDAAEPAFCPDTDQRGSPRPHGDGCDIGAIESTTAAPAPPPIEPPPPCPLELQIVAANSDAPAGGCPAGNGHDVIELTRDIVLSAATPAITSEITIEGNGYTISGRDRFRIFMIKSGKLTLNNMTLTRGSNAGLNDAGAAIGLIGAGKLEANNVLFSMNLAHSGAAIGARFGGSMTIRKSRFEDNRAFARGGAIAMNGGGYANISDSVFVNNKATAFGGAISTTSGILAVSNSVFIGNRARKGGVITADGSRADGPIPITFTHVTMLNNRAALGSGASGIHLFDYALDDVQFRLRNSVLVSQSLAPDCQGRLAQNVGNFIADGSCWPKLKGDPMLAAADDSPASLALPPGSPLIDAADARFCLDSDQLGNGRPLGFGCDIGAIELTPVIRALSSCQLRTTHTLNFRMTPGGQKMGTLPHSSTVTAMARTPGWFNVEYNGASGWISADYVRTDGACN